MIKLIKLLVLLLFFMPLHAQADEAIWVPIFNGGITIFVPLGEGSTTNPPPIEPPPGSGNTYPALQQEVQQPCE